MPVAKRGAARGVVPSFIDTTRHSRVPLVTRIQRLMPEQREDDQTRYFGQNPPVLAQRCISFTNPA